MSNYWVTNYFSPPTVSGGDTTPPAAPVLTFVGTTSTTFIVHVDVPAADHTQTIVYIGPKGSASTANQTVTVDGNVTFTGLTAGTEYWVVAYSEDAEPNNSIPSNVVLEFTPAVITSPVDGRRLIIPIRKRAFKFAPFIESIGTSLNLDLFSIEFELEPIRGQLT